jgi:GGDEF domain-containing protein
MNQTTDALIAALQHSELRVALFDAQGQLAWANASYRADELAPRRTGADAVAHGRRHETADGRALWVSETPLPDGGLLLVAAEMAEASEAAEVAAPAAPVAAPAGGQNVMDRAAAALGDLRARRQPFSLALVEIDGTASDAQLNHFARHCRQHLRPGDTMGRLGERQLVLLLPGAGPLAATAIVERLSRRLAEPVPGDTSSAVPYGFCAGLAQAKAGEAVDVLLQRARSALGTARQRGPGANRIVLYQS